MKNFDLLKKLFSPVMLALILFSGVMAQDDIRTFKITGTDNMKFDVTSIEATAGEKIRIVYTTNSRIPKQAMAHNVVILDQGTDVQAFANASARARDNQYIAPDFKNKIIAATDLAGGGETVEVTFVVPSVPGEYEYICSFPGHYGAGMKGILTVKK